MSPSGDGADAPKAFGSSLQDFEERQIELINSERVEQSLRGLVVPLQKKCDELEVWTGRNSFDARTDDRCTCLEHEIEAASEELRTAECQLDASNEELAHRQREQAECTALAAARESACAETRAACESMAEALDRADARRDVAVARARSMVSSDVLSSTAAEAQRLQGQLAEQEAEQERLSAALADSWAARLDPDAGNAHGPRAAADLRDLDNLEEELKAIAKMQQQASAEAHHVGKLEHSESTLEKRIRELAEHKASLQSTRVDLGDEGRAMREAIASQNESHLQKVFGLEEKRRITDGDRKKLIQKCADMQDQLTALEPQLATIADLEGRHEELEAEERRLAEDSRRLSDVNGALGVLLMGGSAGIGSPAHGSREDGSVVLAEKLTHVFKLHRRYNERLESQLLEKEKLAERLRALEKEAAQGSFMPREGVPPRAPEAQAAPASAAGAIASKASTALRGGLDRLRGMELL